MLHQLHPVRMVDKRIARNSRLRLIGFGESSVNNEQFAICLHRLFTLNCLYRHMTIDDMRMRSQCPKLI